MANNRELSQFASTVGHNGGNIGFGTDAPDAKLEVRDGNSQGIIVRSNSTQATDTNKALRVRNNSDTNTFHVSHKGQGYFAGSVGINSASPREKLDVKAGRIILDQDYQFTWANGSTNRARIYGDSGNNFIVENGSSNTERFRIRSDGKLMTQSAGYVYTASSSGSLSLYGGNTNLGGGIVLGGGNDNADIRFLAEASTATPAERVRITSAGLVGIGTDNPSGKLNIAGSDSQLLNLIQDSGDLAIRLNDRGVGSAYIKVRDNTSGSLSFDTGGSERLRIESDGQVVINRTAAVLANTSSKLEVFNSTENLIFVSNSTAATGQDAGIMFGPANNVYGGKIIVTSDEDFSTSANRTAHMAFYTRQDGTASEKLRITSDGKLGVGVAAPAQMMEITNTAGTGTQIQLRDTSTGTGSSDGARFGYNGSGAQIWNFENTYIRFATNNVERFRITSDGKVGLKNTSPDENLHLDGALKQDGHSNSIQYTQMCFTLPSGSTSTMFTLTGNGNDATAMAVLEYVALYSYAGSNHCAGIEYASTRRSSNNSAWTDTDNQSVAVSGNDTSIAPNIYWENGVLKISTGSSVQITGTLRLTTRRFTVTRNFNAG
jgi:hypothetical protein